MRHLSVGIFAALLMFVEYQLCVKFKNPLIGGIIPSIILVATISLFDVGIVPLKPEFMFPFVVLNTLMLSDWCSGREQYRKKQQQELDKMRAKDI